MRRTDEAATVRRDVVVASRVAAARPAAADRAARRPATADDTRERGEAPPIPARERRHRAAPSTTRPGATPPDGLVALATAAGFDVPRLARALGLGRAPLIDLVRGRVTLPAPVALLAALADALDATVAAVDAATRAAPEQAGRPGVASAPPRRPFADIVRDDPSTPPELKTRWLDLLTED